MSQPFTNLQAKFLKSFTEALFHGTEMVISADDVVDNIQQHFEIVGGTKVQELRIAVSATSVVLGGIFFRMMPVAMRAARVKSRLEDSQFDLFQDMARLRGIVYACYYGHWLGNSEDDNRFNPVHRQIGFTLPRHRTRTPAERPLSLVPGREIAAEHIVPAGAIPDEVDVIVAGSGAGGAVSAWNLAKQGLSVLVVEAGPFYPSPRITHCENIMAARLFKHGALQTTKNSDFIVFQGRCVGGSSTINNGICLPLADPGVQTHPRAHNVLDHWDSIGATIDRSRLQQGYANVAAMLQVREIEHGSSRENGPHLLRGFHAWQSATDDPMAPDAVSGWFRKNFGPAGTDSACAYCGYCNTGCPYGRRMGVAQTYLPRACADHGARILPDSKVARILWDDDNTSLRRATGVVVIDPDGVERQIKARKGVVVAGGTISSSKLLARSGVDGTGHGISLNIASPVVGLMPAAAPTSAWDEDQMATYVDMGEYLLESHFQPPMSMASLMPGWFADHGRRMQNWNRTRSAGILFPADRRGQIVNGKLDFHLDDEVDLPVLRRAMATLSRVHFAAGAEEVYPAIARGVALRPSDDIDEFFVRYIREADDVTLSSSHPHGGNAINADPSLGVVDTDCRVHGTANVLVTDASVLPSCIRVNAQFTTMAMADYATAAGNPFS